MKTDTVAYLRYNPMTKLHSAHLHPLKRDDDYEPPVFPESHKLACAELELPLVLRCDFDALRCDFDAMREDRDQQRRMKGMAREQRDTMLSRATELEKALRAITELAQQVDGWEQFPMAALDAANDVLDKYSSRNKS